MKKIVIAKNDARAREVVKKHYNLKLDETEICYHDLDLLLGISKEERDELVKVTLLEDLSLIDGAKEALMELYSENNQIFILTARSKELENITRYWLEQKGIPYSHLFILNEGKKHLADIKPDLVVEDNLEDAIGWSKVKNILLFELFIFMFLEKMRECAFVKGPKFARAIEYFV